jgi:hypothetical protein
MTLSLILTVCCSLWQALNRNRNRNRIGIEIVNITDVNFIFQSTKLMQTCCPHKRVFEICSDNSKIAILQYTKTMPKSWYAGFRLSGRSVTIKDKMLLLSLGYLPWPCLEFLNWPLSMKRSERDSPLNYIPKPLTVFFHEKKWYFERTSSSYWILNWNQS